MKNAPARNTIITLHPEKRKGAQIDRIKYQVIRDFIVGVMEEENEILFEILLDRAKKNLSDEISGNIAWYVLTVKLDLEARGIIANTFSSKNRRLQLLKFKKSKMNRIEL